MGTEFCKNCNSNRYVLTEKNLSNKNYPDEENGNVIIIGHSGNYSNSYFGDLYQLELKDTASIQYKGKKYNYKVVNVYYVGMLPKEQEITPDMLVRLTKMTWWNKKPEDWQFFAAVEGAFPEKSMKNPAYGISIGYVKEYGVYAKVLFSATPSTDHEWDDFTTLKPWTQGEYKSGTQAYVVGGMIRLGCPFYLNLGLGYMNRTIAWKLSDGSWAKYNDDSYNGFCIDAGLTLRIGDHFLVNGGILAGMKTAKAPYIGVGYSF